MPEVVQFGFKLLNKVKTKALNLNGFFNKKIFLERLDWVIAKKMYEYIKFFIEKIIYFIGFVNSVLEGLVK